MNELRPDAPRATAEHKPAASGAQAAPTPGGAHPTSSSVPSSSGPPAWVAGRDQDATEFPAPLDWGSLPERRITKWVKDALRNAAPEIETIDQLFTPGALREINTRVKEQLLREAYSPVFDALDFPTRSAAEELGARFSAKGIDASAGLLITVLDAYKNARHSGAQSAGWKMDEAFVQALLAQGPDFDPTRLI